MANGFPIVGDFFFFFEGKFRRKFGGTFRDIFDPMKIKTQTFRGQFRSIFRGKFRSSKKIFRANFVLQTCHPDVLVVLQQSAGCRICVTGPLLTLPCGETYERRREFTTKPHANLVLQACISFLRCFRAPGAPIRKRSWWRLDWYPVLSLNGLKIMQICISFRSRSGCWPLLGLFRNPGKPNFKECECLSTKETWGNAGNFLSRFAGMYLISRCCRQFKRCFRGFPSRGCKC